MPRKIHFWEPMVIPGNPKISIAVAAYKRPDLLSCLLWGFKTQTYENWEINVIHDGPGPECRAAVEGFGDERIRIFETSEQRGHWGHPWREYGISKCTGEFIGLTDDDNFYAPVYFEWMLAALIDAEADFAHCDIVHSHRQFQYFPTEPRRFHCDLGSWVARASTLRGVPWTDFGHDGDGTFIESVVRRSRKVVHVPGVLMLHN
jgi:glycosyltransferase involved in cell wall biosynthesis